MQAGMYQIALCVLLGIFISINVGALIYKAVFKSKSFLEAWVIGLMGILILDLGMFILRLGNLKLLNLWWYFPLQQGLKHLLGLCVLLLLSYLCKATRWCKIFCISALVLLFGHFIFDVLVWGDWPVVSILTPWGEHFYQVASTGIHRILDLAFAVVLVAGVISRILLHRNQCHVAQIKPHILSWIALFFVMLYAIDLGLRFTDLGALRVRWFFGLALPGVVIWQWLKTERQLKSLLEQEHRTAELLQKRNHEQEQVLRMVSHDLRSPLVNLSGFLREIQDDPAMNSIAEDTRYCMDQMDRSIQRMGHLLEALGQVVRHGRRKVSLIKVDLAQVCREMVEMSRLQLQSAEATVETSELPMCLGDPEIIAEVLQNLFENAMKYRQAGRKLHIQIRSEVGHHDRIRLIVEDNGRGMNPQLAERAFELYVRLDNAKDQRGDGLGLFLIRNLVRDMGGEIRIESSEGLGTRVIVELLESK